jgi:hypothetical protein
MKRDIALFSVVAGVIVALTLFHMATRSFGEFHGVRLGMTMEQAHAAFAPGGPGQGEVELACGGIRLEWKPEGQAPVRWARFELHEGILEAIRARVAADDFAASGEPLASTASVVVARERSDDGDVAVAILSRQCPEHSAEVEQLLARGPMRR